MQNEIPEYLVEFLNEFINKHMQDFSKDEKDEFRIGVLNRFRDKEISF